MCEIKIVTLADGATIFLKDITCFHRIRVILKLYEHASSSKINFSKSQSSWDGAYKNWTDQPGQMKWLKFPLKYLELNL